MVTSFGHLHAQLERGFARLRFTPLLEAEFRRDYFVQGLPFRRLLLALSLLMLLGVTAFDTQLFGAPVDFNRVAHPLQRLLIFPALLYALWTCRNANRQTVSDWSLVFAAMVVVLVVLAQRSIGVHYGFDVPLEFTATTIASVFFLGRLRFNMFFPIAVLLSAAVVINEWLFVQPDANGWYRVVVAVMLLSISMIGGYFFEYVIRDAWLNRRLLEYMSNQDPLTDLLNRRGFDSGAQRVLRQASRQQRMIAIAMFDLDHFKHFNDRFGHPAGDACLQAVGRILNDAAKRPLDCCGRYGGEEFIVAWFDVTPSAMAALADQVRRRIEGLDIGGEAGITASVGLVCITPDSEDGLDDLVQQADNLLYQAKEQGRNRVMQSSPDSANTDLGAPV